MDGPASAPSSAPSRSSGVHTNSKSNFFPASPVLSTTIRPTFPEIATTILPVECACAVTLLPLIISESASSAAASFILSAPLAISQQRLHHWLLSFPSLLVRKSLPGFSGLCVRLHLEVVKL